LTPNNGDAGREDLAGQIAAYVEVNFRGAEQRLDLVGFSMGGLVSRYYVQRLGGSRRVDHLVTISAPHGGTWTAYLQCNRGARQMRPGSPFLKDLQQDVETLKNVRFVSVWTPFDLMILPARSSELSCGRSIPIRVALHPWMVRDPRVIDLVGKLLCE
jgi:triacylglycerol lipase